MKIVVLAGGLSPERNVSLSTGVMVTEALRRLGPCPEHRRSFRPVREIIDPPPEQPDLFGAMEDE